MRTGDTGQVVIDGQAAAMQVQVGMRQLFLKLMRVYARDDTGVTPSEDAGRPPRPVTVVHVPDLMALADHNRRVAQALAAAVRPVFGMEYSSMRDQACLDACVVRAQPEHTGERLRR